MADAYFNLEILPNGDAILEFYDPATGRIEVSLIEGYAATLATPCPLLQCERSEP